MSDRHLAAFDFDGTLTDRDTLVGFLRTAFGTSAVVRAFLAGTPDILRARLGRSVGDAHPRDAAKEAVLRALTADHRADDLDAKAAAYATTLPERLRPDVLDRLRWHRSQGHDVIVVSASLLTYLTHLRSDLDLVDVLACELAVDEHGVLTGSLARPNVRGPEKEARLRAWMAEREPYGTLWAYGNSSGDRELLAMADRPTMVGRRPITPAPTPTD